MPPCVPTPGLIWLVEHVLHGSGDRVLPPLVRVVDPQPAAGDRRVELDRGAGQVGGARRVEHDRQAVGFDRQVVIGPLARVLERDLVAEAGALLGDDADAEDRLGEVVEGADAVDLGSGRPG